MSVFASIRSQFQCLDGLAQYSHDIQRLSEFQTLEGKENNSNILNDKARIPLFGWIRSEFQCSER